MVSVQNAPLFGSLLSRPHVLPLILTTYIIWIAVKCFMILCEPVLMELSLPHFNIPWFLTHINYKPILLKVKCEEICGWEYSVVW
jgi:hypothetical protein